MSMDVSVNLSDQSFEFMRKLSNARRTAVGTMISHMVDAFVAGQSYANLVPPEPEPSYVIVECKACNGRGRDQYRHSAVCIGCNGSGKHRL